jgi:hypothetical protein
MIAKKILKTARARKIDPLIPFQQAPHVQSNPIRNLLAHGAWPLASKRQNA